MSGTSATPPVFLVAAAGTATDSLMQALRSAVGSGAATLVAVAGGEDAGGSVPVPATGLLTTTRRLAAF